LFAGATRRLFVFLLAFDFKVRMNGLKKIDHSALTVNQVTIVLLNILAFVLNLPWLAANRVMSIMA